MNSNEKVARKLIAGISSLPDKDAVATCTDGEFLYRYTVRSKTLFVEIAKQLIAKPDFELLNMINNDAHVGKHAISVGNVYSYEAEFQAKGTNFTIEEIEGIIAIADTEAQNAYTMLSNMTVERVKELQRISRQCIKNTIQ